jgi:hypothetical protein
MVVTVVGTSPPLTGGTSEVTHVTPSVDPSPPFGGALGPRRARRGGRIGLTELVVHAWDLARALDRPAPELPDETLRACLDHVTVFVPGAPLPELWGDPVTPGADAGMLERIVAVTGRRP